MGGEAGLPSLFSDKGAYLACSTSLSNLPEGYNFPKTDFALRAVIHSGILGRAAILLLRLE